MMYCRFIFASTLGCHVASRRSNSKAFGAKISATVNPYELSAAELRAAQNVTLTNSELVQSAVQSRRATTKQALMKLDNVYLC